MPLGRAPSVDPLQHAPRELWTLVVLTPGTACLWRSCSKLSYLARYFLVDRDLSVRRRLVNIQAKHLYKFITARLESNWSHRG
jgi:hypothetical protein